jgi:hypothetical protein
MGFAKCFYDALSAEISAECRIVKQSLRHQPSSSDPMDLLRYSLSEVWRGECLMRKLYVSLAVWVWASATAACRAQVEILPMPKTESAKPPVTQAAPPTPVVQTSHADHPSASFRERFDEWITFQPLYHPHLCSPYSSSRVEPCCDPPLYAFFLARCDNFPSCCPTAIKPAPLPVQLAPCEKHPLLAYWQHRACCVRTHVSGAIHGAIDEFKTSATCPVCHKKTYFALWGLHDCTPELYEVPEVTETKPCPPSSASTAKKTYFALWPQRHTATDDPQPEPRAVRKDGGHILPEITPGKAK